MNWCASIRVSLPQTRQDSKTDKTELGSGRWPDLFQAAAHNRLACQLDMPLLAWSVWPSLRALRAECCFSGGSMTRGKMRRAACQICPASLILTVGCSFSAAEVECGLFQIITSGTMATENSAD